MLDIEWRETVSKIRSSDTLKNVFIADGSYLVKLFQKFSSSMLETEWWGEKNMDIHYQKCQKMLCQTLGFFCLGFEVWFWIQFPGCPMEMWVWFFPFRLTQKLRRTVQECEVRPGLYLGASRGFGLKKKFFNVVLLSILITKV